MECQNRGGYNNSKKAASMTHNVMGVEVDTGYVRSTLMMGLVYVFVLQRNVNVFPTMTVLMLSFQDVLSGKTRVLHPGKT